jgi:hypothetical protein
VNAALAAPLSAAWTLGPEPKEASTPARVPIYNTAAVVENTYSPLSHVAIVVSDAHSLASNAHAPGLAGAAIGESIDASVGPSEGGDPSRKPRRARSRPRASHRPPRRRAQRRRRR